MEIQVKAAQQEAAHEHEVDEPATDTSKPVAVESSPIKPPTKRRKPIDPEPLETKKKRKVKVDPDEAPKAKKVKTTTKGQESKRKPLPTKTKKLIDSESEELSETNTPSIPRESPTASPRPKNQQVDDESELSDLVDDSPKPKSKKSHKEPKQNNSTAKSKPVKKSKADKGKASEDPETERIKSLQGWLLKCGIRKVWGSYLKPYETPKAKIKHLESMLSDVGMTGRFSLEKASQIKEKRELAADLEAVQEGDKKWGKVESEEDSGRPKRRLAKGFEGLDFLGDDDGEETD